MWKCECGEFNNDDLEFCVACQRVRLSEPAAQPDEKKEPTTRAIFRRIQDFILLDIAFCAMVALYCFFVEDIIKALAPPQFGTPQVSEALKTTLPIIAIILFQVLLLINILRMLYSSALSSEKNTLFLRRIYQMLKENEGSKKKPTDED